MLKAMHAYHGGWTESEHSFWIHMAATPYGAFVESVSKQSKQQILQPLSVLRPKFRVGLTSSYAFTSDSFHRPLHSPYEISWVQEHTIRL